MTNEGLNTALYEKMFADFSEEEIEQLFQFYAKLYAGVERVEQYAEKLDK